MFTTKNDEAAFIPRLKPVGFRLPCYNSIISDWVSKANPSGCNRFIVHKSEIVLLPLTVTEGTFFTGAAAEQSRISGLWIHLNTDFRS